jgi:adenylate kinase
MINLIFLGPPGAGKGTQSAYLIRDYGLVQISTGDLLRQAVKDQTPLGKEAKVYMDAGQLVPDSLIIGLMKDRLSAPDCGKGVIFDGFPRTIAQAEALDAMLKEDLKTEITHIISLEVADELLVDRAVGRRTCPKDGKVYHIKFNPSKVGGICDLCGGTLVHRDDDSEATIKNRLKVYHETTSLLKGYYGESGKFYSVDGKGNPDNVFSVIRGILG